MLLDTSDEAWKLFLTVTQKAKDANVIWYSPKEMRPYYIKEVHSKIIIHREAGGQDEELGKKGFLTFLEHFNNYDGKYRRKDYHGSVAKMACIVNFHPMIKWSGDMEMMEIIENPSRGLISYIDFGSPPNDDVTQLQAFARKIRRGQAKFRTELLIAYNGACCITQTNVEETLDACHIEAHAKRGINKITNGLLLRTDIHNLFDSQLLFIEPTTYTVHVHPKLAKTHYYQYDQTIMSYYKVKPDDEYLTAHWQKKSW